MSFMVMIGTTPSCHKMRSKHKNFVDLLTRDAGKPCKEFVDGCARIKILKQSLHGNACVTKDPCSTDFGGVVLNCITLCPVHFYKLVCFPVLGKITLQYYLQIALFASMDSALYLLSQRAKD